MVGLIDVKRKGGASVGYWVNYVTLTFDLTHDLDLWFFSRSKLKIAVSQQLFSDWCETKRKQINSILGCLYGLALWPHPWPWPCSFKVKNFLNNLIWGMEVGVGADWQVTKGMWVDHSWPWPLPMGNRGGGGWMYHIVTGVTSDVGVPLTYLVVSETGPVQWIFGQHCGYWQLSTLATGHH